MTTTDISPIAESAFAMMGADEEERAFVEEKAKRIAAATNWFARKKLFFELIEELDATSELASELAEMPELTALMEEAVKQLKETEFPPPEAGQPAARRVADDESPASDAALELEDELLPDDPFAIIAPVYVGAILERLDEKRIECLEQAAIYVLSTHEEHQLAAWSWFNAAPKGLERFRKFMKANPRYHEALQRLVFVETPADDGEER